MSRILCIWELGGGYGHLSRFLPIALTLRKRNHEVIFALKELPWAEPILGKHGFSILQAPVWPFKMAGFPNPPLNYAEILQRFGFINKPGLTGMVKAWRSLYELVKPDLLIIDHGPTALLASRGTKISRTIIGSGFSSPPRTSPLPNMRPWLNVSEGQLISSDQKVLEVVNGVLADLGVPPMKILAELFKLDEDFLCTFPELDHYQIRGEAHYWGPIFDLEGGPHPQWPLEGDKKIFAYLKNGHRDFEKILGVLREMKHCSLIHATGISENFIKKNESSNMKFITHLVSLEKVRQETDLIICHAGNGTTCATLLGGRPLLLLPTQLEQYLFSLNIVNYGAGLVANPEIQNIDYGDLVNQLLTKPSFTERAQAFAKKYEDFDQPKQLDSIVNRCEEIIELGVRA